MHRFLLTLLLLALPLTAQADTARLQSLGDMDLFTEDDANAFTNPALMARYSNRAWFSLGVNVPSFTAEGLGGTTVSPLGGAAVRIKKVVTLGVVLNRSPQLYGFQNAFWPVLTQYLPQGPGGNIEGPDGPLESSAPLRFPLDLFIAAGDAYAPLRIGVNLYYAGGSSRDWAIDDGDRDDLEDTVVVRKETHLFNGTFGISGGSIADRVRPEGWVRVTWASAWHDEQSDTELSAGQVEPTVDRILAMDRDVRVGGGFRVHVGDAEKGLVVTPGFQYDFANGAFRFDDNLVAPDSSAELSARAANAHDARLGVGVAWRGEDLLVTGSASLRVRSLERVDDLDVGDDGIERLTDQQIDLTIPEVSIGAEYRIVPVLLVRAGIKATVVGGRGIGTHRGAVGDADSPFEYEVIQNISTAPVQATLQASGGLGLQVKRFHADAIVGSLLVGSTTGAPSFFSRIDLGFSFD